MKVEKIILTADAMRVFRSFKMKFESSLLKVTKETPMFVTGIVVRKNGKLTDKTRMIPKSSIVRRIPMNVKRSAK